MSDPKHQHVAVHTPQYGTGYAVCECGATIRVVEGKQVGEWHVCPLCVGDKK